MINLFIKFSEAGFFISYFFLCASMFWWREHKLKGMYYVFFGLFYYIELGYVISWIVLVTVGLLYYLKASRIFSKKLIRNILKKNVKKGFL